MKELYLDIFEKALSAYTPERIRDYIDEVKRDGLREHGFPRLGVNIGVLIAYGRRVDLMDTFLEIIDICCEEMPKSIAGNDFTVREMCCLLMLLESKGTVEKERIEGWKNKLRGFDPWKYYTVVDSHTGEFVANWAMFSGVSEYLRGAYLGIDTHEFVEWQLPGQLANFDENGMYMDDPPFANHTIYDLVPRFLTAFLLRAGYKGKYAKRLEAILDKAAELTLKTQSPTGEIGFGGRSNQFMHNESMLAAYCEMEASRFYEKGDVNTAGEFKAAALLAARSEFSYLSRKPISHVKNRYDISTLIGCEDYAYFNKYMITTASNLYPAIMFGNDDIKPTVALATKGGIVASTSDAFHRTYLTAGGYHAQVDTLADFMYDASGIGRIHKAGCPAVLCLSTPFCQRPHYILEEKNPSSMSICPYINDGGRLLFGAEKYARYILTDKTEAANEVSATFRVDVTREFAVTQKITVNANGVDIETDGADGIMLPAFAFDGKDHTKISAKSGEIRVEYEGYYCKYSFVGTPEEYKTYYNRNGRYKVFKVPADKVHVEMGKINEI